MAEDHKTPEDQGLATLAGPTGNKIQPVDADARDDDGTTKVLNGQGTTLGDADLGNGGFAKGSYFDGDDELENEDIYQHVLRIVRPWQLGLAVVLLYVLAQILAFMILGFGVGGGALVVELANTGVAYSIMHSVWKEGVHLRAFQPGSRSFFIIMTVQFCVTYTERAAAQGAHEKEGWGGGGLHMRRPDLRGTVGAKRAAGEAGMDGGTMYTVDGGRLQA